MEPIAMPDRFGEPTEPEQADDLPVEPACNSTKQEALLPLPATTADDGACMDPRCKKGWIDRDADNPRPCLRCKPHLGRRERLRKMGLGDKK
ncbi:hypothetical protein BBK82_03690 [Lentzea guizhouensis]|uniref:Uncharacterized protein n=1 Tax=Lentzea guizhouensis TaxID=1586287 RepID=A0A1B2HC88_9PSEU|nr:hypothetical protein [Lentzea guizhouensis]ANZ35319.1 hypothetical protein BBK82_03690 [Lentzea guizhouensis]